MAGYIRNDTTNNIADGNIINAADLDGEFDALASAFTTSGHDHGGTAQNGGAIVKIGPAQEIEVTASTMQPKTTNTTNLGTTGLTYANVYIADDKYIQLGNAQDIKIGYDETTTDSLKIAATEGAGLAITLMADEGDDAGDEWKLNIADGGTLTLGNDIASAGTYVTHLTLTPHATITSSALAVAGILELSDGSASAPSLTNTGDTNAGLYFSAADTLAFTAGGVAQFTMADGVVAPVTDSDVDLGTSSLYFKDAFIDKITTTGVIELGHASETTLSGSSGVLSVEGTAVIVAGAQTSLTTDYNNARKIGRDTDNLVDFATTDDEIQFVAAGTKRATINAGGITVNSTHKLTFGDAASFIQQSGDGVMQIDGEASINMNASTAVTIDTPSLIIQDDTTSEPIVQIKNTHNGTTAGELRFVMDKGSAGADGDDLGTISFYGDDAGQNQTAFAKIVGEVSEADETDEAGKLSFYVAESDGTNTALTAGLVLEGEHATDGEVDVTIGAGAASTTTVAGDLNVAGGDIIFGSAGKGINLGVTANTDANTLDDFEEGTWSGLLRGAAGSAGTAAGNTATGYYMKVANAVFISFTCTVSNLGSWSSTVQVNGLPFTVGGSINYPLALGFHDFHSNSNTRNVCAQATANQDYIYHAEPDSTSFDWTNLGLGIYSVSGWYRTDV